MNENQIKALYLTYLVNTNQIIPKKIKIASLKSLLQIKSPYFNHLTLLEFYNKNVKQHYKLGMKPYQMAKILSEESNLKL